MEQIEAVEQTSNVVNVDFTRKAVLHPNIIKTYENTMISLLQQKPFFAKLIMSMRKDFMFKAPTAAVSVSSTGINLHINPEFFEALTHSERVGVLTHECLHLVHSHLVRFNMKESTMVDAQFINLACDVAINQFIPELPTKMMVPDGKGGMQEGQPVTLEQLRKYVPEALAKQSSEYYFSLFKQNEDKFPKMHILDDHSQWDDSDLTEEQKQKMVKGHVKAIMDTCASSELTDLDQSIIDSFKKSKVNWKSILRQFFANSEEVFTERSRKKRNRRYGIIQPGNKNEMKLKLGIAVDTSGSISEDELQLFFSEIDRMFDEQKTVLYIMEADTVIRDVYEYKRGMKITPKGRGGTAYNPALIKAKELGVDACIYFGDMDSADEPVKPRGFSVLWASVRKETNPFSFGKFMKVE